MSDRWEEVPVLSRHRLNENEERALGGWFSVHDHFPADYEFLQTEVPLAIQRVAEALGRSLESDLTKMELLSGDDVPTGFLNKKNLSDEFGFSISSNTISADVIMVRKEGIDIVEIKTAKEAIESAKDIYKGLGQVLMYLDCFQEDYPSIANHETLRGFILAEDSDIDIELIEQTFKSQSLGFFDPIRGGFLVEPQPI